MAKKPGKKKSAKLSASKPVELIFSLVCDSVARDPNSDKPTLYGVFDAIKPEKLPVRSPINFFAKVNTPPGRHEISVHLMSPSGKQKEVSTGEIDGEDEGVVQIHIAFLAELDESGVYSLQLKSGRKLIGKACRFTVLKKDKP